MIFIFTTPLDIKCFEQSTLSDIKCFELGVEYIVE